MQWAEALVLWELHGRRRWIRWWLCRECGRPRPCGSYLVAVDALRQLAASAVQAWQQQMLAGEQRAGL